ncbi:MAG: secretin and TonB N-terminal domain-containing protein [Candidatus Omnitrophota bacterium]
MKYLKMRGQKSKNPLFVFICFLIFSLFFSHNFVLAQEWTPVFSNSEKGQALEGEPLEKDTASESKLSERISLDYKNVDLVNVLRSLAWTYNLNIITGPDIQGKVTVNLQDVTVRDALTAILTINGLAYSERSGIIYISSGSSEIVETQNEVIFLKYLSASEAQNLLKKVISTKGDMKVNEVTNSLIITDFISNIQKAKFLLQKIDIAPMQVIIEAKIVDITSTDLASLGITWDANYQPGQGIFDRSTKYSEQAQGTIDMATESSLDGGQIVLNTLSLKGLTVTATIDALVKDGKANLLASPSIAVLNGNEARIVIGERYPYKERTQTASGTTETTKFVDIGTSLRVTPQINDDGYITMRIHPEVSSLAESLDAGPRITTREADTTVRVKEGETLVIGGLIKQTDSSSREKIPFLGDLPILGLLFSRSEKSAEQKELAVFITPKVLRSQEEKTALAKKKRDKEEVYINITKTGELSVVERIFKQAQALDRGKGIESVRKNKQFRDAQALSLYEHISVEFPHSQRAPEAMYRAGMIYYKDLKDYKKTKDTFSRLISDYPKSPFVTKAKKIYKKLALPLMKVKQSQPVDLKILME